MDTNNLSLNELAEKTLRSFNTLVNTSADMTLNISSSPIVGLVDRILNDAIFKIASDIHIEPTNTILNIRFRIDGMLYKYAALSLTLHPFIIARLKIISKLNTVEKRKPQDGNLSYSYLDKIIDIRIAIIPTIYGEKIVLRLLNTSGKLLNINELDLSTANKQLFKKLYTRPSGLILNTGPVNSGKTTTLYAALQELNSVEKNIMTIEDPVEYKLEGINQVQIYESQGLNFNTGLRAILRQDPSIILIGEIRDNDTAKTAVRAALTGHLVLSTLHASNAASAVLRLLDMQIEPYLLSATLAGCLSQRLVRKICPNCIESYVPEINSTEYKFLQKHHIHYDKLYRGRGCNKCNNSGYHGRIAIHEIFLASKDIKNAIYNTADSNTIEKLAQENGMISLLQDGLNKCLDQKTTLTEIMRINDND
ncbi:GspE/PulE family protein [Pectinatus brassicae]|uniref:Type IV pilus assembly protein PilB n=1 Tax=Pectinatus brassicae TaxID=862415 RepID=A0A840UUL6_9FIRM|nr:GspE/PulE family protein [Pectinatus brassicae]MBB5336504.1 type IV pilus assembly protein PilB [Pectinatus brassicae]